MSLDAMESDIEEIRAKVADLNDSYSRSQAEIAADTTLTEAGKAEAITPLHETLTATVAALHQREKTIVQNKREALERNLYGTSGSATDISGFREAQAIAARITDADEAHATYTNALRSNDTMLARAVFQHAQGRGWDKVIEDHIARNPAAKAALNDLERISRYEQNTLGATVHYMTPKLSTAQPVMPIAVTPGELNAFFHSGAQAQPAR